MKVEFNSNFVDKVKKQLAKEGDLSRRRNFKKKNINKSYFILLGFMVLLIGANVSRNINNEKVDESAAPVFSNTSEKEDIIKESEKRSLDVLSFELPVSKEKILSYNFANGILNMQVEKNEEIYSMTDGSVENTYLDYSYGYTVVIKGNDNTIFKYSNLDSNIPVKIGENIVRGQTIGKTLDYALLNASYLYISVLKSGENINITELFDNIK